MAQRTTRRKTANEFMHRRISLRGLPSAMAKPKTSELRVALRNDLKLTGSKGGTLVNDTLRKTFTVRSEGTVMEFAHKQSDAAYWNGVKYYGSGSNSRIRIRRTALVEKTSVAESVS